MIDDKTIINAHVYVGFMSCGKKKTIYKIEKKLSKNVSFLMSYSLQIQIISIFSSLVSNIRRVLSIFFSISIKIAIKIWSKYFLFHTFYKINWIKYLFISPSLVSNTKVSYISFFTFIKTIIKTLKIFPLLCLFQYELN